MSARRPHTSDPSAYADEASGWEAAFEGGLAHDRRFVRGVLGDAAFDARLLVARLYGRADWAALEAAVRVVPDHDPFVRANAAVDAVDGDALARALAAEPAIVRERGPWGDTLLQRALWKVDHGDWSWLPGPADDPDGERLALARTLLAAGADVSHRNDRAWTPLHTAAYIGHRPLIEVLLEHGASVHGSAQGDGGTPLCIALFWGHDAAAERLAEVEVVPENLRVAAGLGRADLVESLGVNGDRREFYRPHEGFPFFKISEDPQQILDEALVYAARNGREQAIARLLDWGADLNADVAGTTPLVTAASYGRTGCCRALLDADPGKIAFRDNDGDTALHAAAWYGRADSVALLLERGADPAARNGAGKTPLELAREREHPDVVERLTGGGVDPG